MRWNFLAENLESNAVYLDCRSEEQYSKATIKSALGAAFIKKPYGSGASSIGKISGYLADLKGRADKNPNVICFDEGEGMYACRLAWVLMGLGISSVKVLGKKFDEIPAASLEPGKLQIEAEPGKPLSIKSITSISQLQKDLTRVQLIDVRTDDEYDGRFPRMSNPEAGSVCGRIPGSVHWDWMRLYNKDGRLRDRDEVMHQIREIGLIPERPTVLYDYNGARSCTTALVLTRCGYRQVSVYLGSWMEWRRTDLPKQNVRVWGKD